MINEKYRPKTINDVKGQDIAVDETTKWANSWLHGIIPEKKALLYYGKPGIGKTSLAYAIAKSCSWNIKEINSSDERKQSDINPLEIKSGVLGNVLWIIDEVDGLKADAGKVLAKKIDHANTPIIFIANELKKVPVSIKKICQEVRFKQPSPSVIMEIIMPIVEKEGYKYSNEFLSKVADNHDIRKAINEIESGRISNTHKMQYLGDITKEFLEGSDFPRNFDQAGLVLYYLDDNIYKFYKGLDLIKAHMILSEADYWRVKRNDNLMCDIMDSMKKTDVKGKINYPSYFMKKKELKKKKVIK